MTLHRLIFAKIFSTLAFQTKGFGALLLPAMNCSMAAIKSGTLKKAPRRIRLLVSSRNHRSTRLSHEEEVRVKCR